MVPPCKIDKPGSIPLTRERARRIPGAIQAPVSAARLNTHHAGVAILTWATSTCPCTFEAVIDVLDTEFMEYHFAEFWGQVEEREGC